MTAIGNAEVAGSEARELSDDDVSTGLRIEPEDVPLVTILGLLRLAEDTAIIRASMGDEQ